MGKKFHEQDGDDVFESYDHDDTGCMGAIFDYHQWYNVKKIFPHRKYNRGRHGRCCVNPRTISMERVIETQGLLHAEADLLQRTRKTGSTTNRSSNKASPKASNKQWIPGFSATPQLHHFEYSGFGFGFGWINPVILINKRDHISYSSSTSSRADTLRSKRQDIHDRTNSSQHGKKLSKDLFIGISHHFPRKQTSEAVKLMRSRSFPVCGLPYLQFSTLDLEHKQMEVWSLRQGEKSVAGTQSSQGSDSRRWNRFVMNRLKDFKQRIKQTLKQVSVKDANNKCRNEDGTDNEICNGGLNRMRRAKSINDSLDRYTKLFQRGVSKEAYLHHSMSLRLSKEGQVPSRELHGAEIFRSISSLSDISFRSLLHAVSRDALSFEVPIRGILNYDANKEKDEHNEPKTITVHEGIGEFELVEAVIEAELQENMREGNNNDPSDLMEKISFRQEQESAFGDNPSRELSRPTSEGPALNHQNLPECEAETFTFSKEKTTMLFESDIEADPSYNYVRDILELSGFLQSKCLHSWYSPDQPLNPSLSGLECSSVDELVTNCGDDQWLVFNLVNEALVEISEKTSIYFPKPFSLMFPGNIVLREVWRKVSRNLAFQPEHDQSLDDIVGRNLEKDAWIIFQPQAESLALEFEDLIFGELLDELLCL